MSEGLLSALNSGKNFNSAGETVTVANVTNKIKTRSKAARILVDKRERTLRVLDESEKLIAFFPASVGGPDRPTPNGLLRVRRTVTNPSYTYNPEFKFRGVEARGKFKIMPGPNNPVGLVWIALGRGYGIHGTPEPEGVSKAASHGCARLTNWDALRLIVLVRRGIPVEFVN
jgi:lipoprotein-anchoring transpeptidase ErfK/SrfK